MSNWTFDATWVNRVTNSRVEIHRSSRATIPHSSTFCQVKCATICPFFLSSLTRFLIRWEFLCVQDRSRSYRDVPDSLL